MKIVGTQKNSFVDYAGKIAYVVFTARCNMNCWYCHNRAVMNGNDFLDEEEVIADIKKRAGFIDAVVITGGEPTLQSDLKDFVGKIKSEGLSVKLDTNGKNPQAVKSLIESNLLDYIAMDIKAPYEKYGSVTGTKDDIDAIKRSVELIMASGVDYEFRTTMSPDLSVEDIAAIAESVAGARLYAIQQFRINENVTKPVFGAHAPDYVKKARDAAAPFVKNAITRGI